MAIGRTQYPGPGRRDLVVYGIGADGIGNGPFIGDAESCPRQPRSRGLAAGSMMPRHMPALVLIRSTTLPGQVYPK